MEEERKTDNLNMMIEGLNINKCSWEILGQWWCKEENYREHN